VQYWDLGTVAATAVRPMWIFRRHGANGPEEVMHPNMIESIPGDTSYTPLRQLYTVYVTSAWDGEKITSLRALEDAIEFGLVETAEAQQSFVDCVVVSRATQLENPINGEAGPLPAYYKGQRVFQFCIYALEDGAGAFGLNNGMFTPNDAYLLRRENELQPLDEAQVKADLNADGDMSDTNTVFDANIGQAGYNAIWKSYDVLVPRAYEFGSAKSQDDLFEQKPQGLAGKEGRVDSFKDNAVFLNRVIRRELP
jgi:hypothetical protein